MAFGSIGSGADGHGFGSESALHQMVSICRKVVAILHRGLRCESQELEELDAGIYCHD
jgi:hypothetical protein